MLVHASDLRGEQDVDKEDRKEEQELPEIIETRPHCEGMLEPQGPGHPGQELVFSEEGYAVNLFNIRHKVLI